MNHRCTGLLLALCSLIVLTVSMAATGLPAGQAPEGKTLHTASALPAIVVTPTPLLTATLTPETCPPNTPFSLAYLPDSAFIDQILPLPDGNILLRGQLDRNDGTWLAKMDPAGTLLWQNVYGTRTGQIHLAPNGNIVFEYGYSNVEIGLDGKVNRAVNAPWYVPLADGSFTVVNGAKITRYRDPQTPLWQVEVKDFGGLSTATSDGGALFAYAGGYTDLSIYYAPQYTDIKVIKVLPDGQTVQRVYGRLVGDEMLDHIHSTGDGGALLIGTHYYEQLGSDYDLWLMKVNASGGMSWQTTLRLSPHGESLGDLFFLKKGYLVVLNTVESNDPVIVRLTSGGSLTWQQVITSSRGMVKINAAADSADGGLLLAGETWEKTGVYWLAKLDAYGRLVWEKTTGTNLPGVPDSEVMAILPLDNKQILISGLTNQVGSSTSETYSAWIAKIADGGEKLGLIKLAPGKVSSIVTLGSRPNTLMNEIIPGTGAALKEAAVAAVQTNLVPLPACLPAGAVVPTPAALPSLTPSVTPTQTFSRNLYLTDPPMQGEDVLKMQQRLFELGYTEVGARDGIFGRMTDAAVRNFQTRNNLAVDGLVGPKTWNKLFSADATRSNP